MERTNKHLNTPGVPETTTSEQDLADAQADAPCICLLKTIMDATIKESQKRCVLF